MKNPKRFGRHSGLFAMDPSKISRRKFIRTTVGAGAGIGLAGGFPAIVSAAKKAPRPKPLKSGIEHVIVVMMENRSFDHFLGWLPGADAQQNFTFLDSAGTPHPTMALSGDYQGCSHPDPDHSYEGGRIEYNNGA